MALTSLTANLMTEDVEAAIAFYKDTLGFQMIMSVPDAPPFDWAGVNSGDVTIFFQTRASMAAEIPLFQRAPPGGALGLFIQTDDIQTLYDDVKSKMPLLVDLHTTFYGMTEFSIQDPNGFVLTFAQPAAEEGAEAAP